MSRKACSEDLRNYFKKSDLLSGLTDLEQQLVRYNLGISTGEGGQTAPLELTYAELLVKINASTLITGGRYEITDFKTIYELNKVSYTCDITPIIVTAISTNILAKEVVLVDHPEWFVTYDVTQETLTDGTNTLGKITYLKDSNNNSACYDFKNVKFIRDDKMYYTFSNVSNSGEITDSSNLTTVHDNKLEVNCWNNVFIGDTYYNIFEADCYNNTFYSGCHDCFFKWETINNIFNEVVVDLTGTIANKTFISGDNKLSTTITKSIHNVNEAVIISYLDPITYAYQIIIV